MGKEYIYGKRKLHAIIYNILKKKKELIFSRRNKSVRCIISLIKIVDRQVNKSIVTII